MFTPNKPLLFLAALLVGFFGVACQAGPVPESTPVTPVAASASRTPQPTQNPRFTATPGVTHVPTDTPSEIDQYCCADFRTGLLQTPATLNYWRFLGEDHSHWTAYVIGDEAPSLYEFSALQFAARPDIVPALALTLPPVGEQRQDFWVIPVKLIESVTWSDGEPLTAHDIVFTIQTVFGLQLGGRWAEFYPAQSLAAVEAIDDHTVEFSFYTQPGLRDWEYAVALGPILPRHYWQPIVAQASADIATMRPPQTCSGELSASQQAICAAFAQARRTLYAYEPVSPPSGGGYITEGYVAQNAIRRKINPRFYAADFKISEYANGAWERVFPDGTLQQFYGQPEGEPLINYHRGPFNPSVELIIFSSPALAYEALAKGNLDFVFNPSSLTDDWVLNTLQSNGITQSANPQNHLAYLAFNLHHPPFDQLEFRQALEILIDRERIIQKDLKGLAYPAYSIVPQQNAFWWNPALIPTAESLNQAARLDAAVQTLKEAGWSWKTEPTWNPETRQMIPGDKLRLPNGQPMPETHLLYPAPETDLLMAAFGQEIAEILTVLGVPVMPEALEREALINRTLVAGGSFDIYILDWYLPLFPEYLCQLFSSTNDTLLTGGYNTTGYTNLAFDTLCVAFLHETEAPAAQKQAHSLQAMLDADLPYIPLFNAQVVDVLPQNVILPYLPTFQGAAANLHFQTDTRVLKR